MRRWGRTVWSAAAARVLSPLPERARGYRDLFSRLVPHASKYRSTVARWCMVYPIGTNGRGRALRGPPDAPPHRTGKERGLPPLHQHISSTSGAPADPAPASPAGRRARRTGAAATVALAALAVGGCGGSSVLPAAGPTSPSATFGGNPPMATVVTIDKVAGTVQKPYHRTVPRPRQAPHPTGGPGGRRVVRRRLRRGRLPDAQLPRRLQDASPRRRGTTRSSRRP